MTSLLYTQAKRQCMEAVKSAWAGEVQFTRIEFDAETNRWFVATHYKSGIMLPRG